MKTRAGGFGFGAQLRTGLFVLLFCASAGIGETEEQSFAVHSIGFAEPETTLEVARSLVGDDGVVILDRQNQRLLVRAGSETHERLRQLLSQLNVAPQNVFIEVEFLGSHESRERGASLGVEGEVVVVDRDVFGRITLRPSVTHRTERGRQETRQSLLVASGREASLHVGERVPSVQWINRWGIRYGMYETEIVWQDVGAFLVVQPTVIGDGPLVRIRLVPELSGLVDGQPHRVRYTRAATEVTVSDGQTVSLGGLAQSDEFFSRFLIGIDQSGGHQTLEIRLTPRLSTP